MVASHWLDPQPERICGVGDRWKSRDGALCEDSSRQVLQLPPRAPLKKPHAVLLPHLERVNDCIPALLWYTYLGRDLGKTASHLYLWKLASQGESGNLSAMAGGRMV